MQHLVLLMHQKLVCVLRGPHPPRSVSFDVDGPERHHWSLAVSWMTVMRMLTVRVVMVLIAPFQPPSPSCPPPLQAPPAALGPAVLPAAGSVPLRSLFPILLLLLLAAPPAHHL